MASRVNGSNPTTPDINNISSSPTKNPALNRELQALFERKQKGGADSPPVRTREDSPRAREEAPKKSTLSTMFAVVKQALPKLSDDKDDQIRERTNSSPAKNQVASPRLERTTSAPRLDKILPNIGKDVHHIQCVVKEITDTEQSFLEGLQEAVKRMKFILDKNDSTQISYAPQLTRAIVKFQTLADVSAVLKNLFSKAFEVDNLHDRFTNAAGVYLSGEYTLYNLLLKECSQLSSFLIEHANSLESNKALMEELKAFRKENPKFEKLDESNLYITPLQRIARHALLIKGVRQIFSTSTPIYKDLTVALEYAELTAKQANYEQKRIDEDIRNYLNGIAEEIKKIADFQEKNYAAELLILALSDYSLDIKDYTFIIRVLDEQIKNDLIVKLDCFLIFFKNLNTINKVFYEKLIKSMLPHPQKPASFLSVLEKQVILLNTQLSENRETATKLQCLKDAFEKLKADIKAN